MVDRKETVRRFLAMSGIGLASVLMLASFTIYTAPHFGWRVDGLRSDSMAPQMNAGDIVVTRPVPAEAVRINDIIIFRSVDKKNNLISHRVIGIETTPELGFKTKGDANKETDPFTVPVGNLVGELAFRLPLLGYGALFLQTKTGLLASLVIPGIFIIAWCLRSLGHEISRIVTGKNNN